MLDYSVFTWSYTLFLFTVTQIPTAYLGQLFQLHTLLLIVGCCRRAHHCVKWGFFIGFRNRRDHETVVVARKVQEISCDLYFGWMWFMINLFISSIEIELINELFYLKTKRLRRVFRMTLSLRTGIGSEYLNAFCRLVYYLTLGDQLRSNWQESSVTPLVTLVIEKATQTSWWYGPLVSLRGHGCYIPRHACHCMLQSPCAAGRPPPLIPMKELAVV